MIVASGTSTPTSTTVVATRSRISPFLKASIDRVLLRAVHAAVNKADLGPKWLASVWKPLVGRHQVGAPRIPRPAGRSNRPSCPRRSRVCSRRNDFAGSLGRHGDGLDRLAAGRLFRELGNIHVAEGGKHQRARDRRRGHDQHMRRNALGGQSQPLVHAETVLLVDDGEQQIVVDDAYPETVRACR